jgi:hypothetical protein
MTKNDGPKKRARAAAKALNVPLSEAKHQAARQHAAHGAVAAPKPAPGAGRVSSEVEQIRFDGKRTGWHVRGHAKDGRYTLVTCKQFENVLYSVIDWEENVRGAMTVIGGGLGIDTAQGEDPAVDEALEMLEDSFEVSHRNRVSLVVSGRRVAGIWHALTEEPAVAEA